MADFPTSPAFATVGVTAEVANYFSETINGRQQVRDRGRHQWKFTANFPRVHEDDWRTVEAFIQTLRGRYGTCTVTLPGGRSSTAGTGTGSVTCSAAAAGATSVTIAGLTGTLVKGDFVKFGHTKVYQLTADRSGAGAITFEPPLFEAVASAETLTYNDVPFTVRLGRDVQSYTSDVNGFVTKEIDFVEALS